MMGIAAPTTRLGRLEDPGWTEVVRNEELGPCWEWNGHCNRARGGYGQTHFGGKTLNVHRLAYEVWIDTIADGLHVLHRCDNPPCINPSHLFLGTNDDNMRDRDSKGRHVAGSSPGSKNPRSKLTESDIPQIRCLLDSGISQAEIARRYSVTRQAIWAIRNRDGWKHV